MIRLLSNLPLFAKIALFAICSKMANFFKQSQFRNRSIDKFWQQYPALLYALAFLIGSVLGLNFLWAFLVPLILLLISIGINLRLLLSLLVMAIGYIYTHTLYQFPTLPEEGTHGEAELQIQSVTSKNTHFGNRSVYKGHILQFDSDLGTTRSYIPFVLSLPLNDEITRPVANQNYRVKGRLKKTESANYQLSVGKHTPWHPIPGSSSLAEWRYQAKTDFTHQIYQKVPSKTAAVFLAAIFTGELDDRLMQYQLGRFGLQHMMAVSGFHFAIITLMLHFLLGFIFPRQIAVLFLMVALSGYFFFLGTSSSVMRAWITILVALIGDAFRQQHSGLNSLGVAMLIVLMVDPMQSQNMGFQFSFMATAAILLFFPTCDQMLKKVFTSRSLSEMCEMTILNQHAYCLLSLFRQGLSLTVAVNLVALPLTFYYFHKFPLLGFAYNLFFPFFISLSIGLLILSLLVDCFSEFLGSFLHGVNSVYTDFMLDFTYKVPPSLDLVWHQQEVSLSLLIVFLSCILFGVIYYHKNARQVSHDLFL